MPSRRSHLVVLAGVLLGMLVACTREPSPSPSSDQPSAPATDAQSANPPQPPAGAEGMEDAHIFEGGAHQDHTSKHGGTFFMALDNRHHLEGTLERPGVFRLYIYDAYTNPISPQELRAVDAKVIWGDEDGAPELPLKPNADGTALEAQAPQPVRFPLTITLLCRFAGSAPNSRPELFTFPFSHYSHVDTTPHTH